MPTERQPEEDAQLSLLAGADAEVLQEQERRGEFTGQRLKRLRPDAYRAIVEQYGGGASMRQLARLYHVSINTVSAVVRAESAAIEAVKKRVGARATAVHSLAWERLEEDLADDEVMRKTTAKDKAVIVGITGDRMQLADGAPTSIVDHRRVEAEDVNRSFLDAIDVQAEEQERRQTGFAGGDAGQKGLPDGAAEGGPAGDSDGERDGERGGDADDKDMLSPANGGEGCQESGSGTDDA